MTNPIQIETGIPVSRRSPGRKLKYPFKQMAVGDSFELRGVNGNSLRSSACGYGQRHNKFFSVTKTDGGLRVWRVK